MNEVLADLYADTGDQRWLALAGKFHHAAHHRSARAEAGHSPRHSRQHANPQTLRRVESLPVHRQRDRRRCGQIFLGRSDAAPHLRHRRQHPKRILRPARSALAHDRRPHRRDLQHLQHDQDVAHAVFHADRTSATPTIRSARCSITSWRRRIPTTAASATWCPSAAACSTNIRVNSSPSPAASGRRWRATRCTPTESTTNRGDKLWVNLYAPSTADWKSDGVKLEAATDLPIGQTADHQGHAAVVEEVHARAAPSLLGGQRIQREGERRCVEDRGCPPDPTSRSPAPGKPATPSNS